MFDEDEEFINNLKLLINKTGTPQFDSQARLEFKLIMTINFI